MENHSPRLIVGDYGPGQPFKLGMALTEIRDAVIAPRSDPMAACRADAVGRLDSLSRPAAFGTFHPAANAFQKILIRNIQRHRGGQCHPALREPYIQKLRLRQTAGKAIENPSARLTFQPFGEDAAHQVIRQIVSLGKNRLGQQAEIRSFLHLFAQQGTRTQIPETQCSRQTPPLGALAGCGWTEDDNPKRLGHSLAQWARL